MNYLGHLLVLPNAGLITLGNLLGDFVKGRPEFIEPPDFRLGVALHRDLDRFTDAHPAVLRSKARIAPERRRIAGILVDVFYDHFLSQGVDVDSYRADLLPLSPKLPEALRGIPLRLISNGWMGSYASVEGIAHVLTRMDQRRKRPLGLNGAESELLRNYDSLAADCAEFFPDAIEFTKSTVPRIISS